MSDNTTNSTNSTMGILGLTFACLGAVFFWLPVIGGIFWLLGAIFSCIGISGRGSSAAWWGFYISFAWILCYLVFGLMFGTYSYFTLYPLVFWF